MNQLIQIGQKSKIRERALISVLYKKPDEIFKTSQIISSKDFYDRSLGNLYQIIASAVNEGRDVLSAVLEARQTNQKIKASLLVEPELNRELKGAEVLAREISKFSRTRKFLEIINQAWIIDKDIDEHIEEFEKKLIEVSDTGEVEDTSATGIIKEIEEVQEKYAQRYEEGEEYLGLATGFKSLDSSIEGLCDGEITFIAGYTSAGKTWFSINVILNILRQQKRVYAYSLEMRKSRLGSRILGLMEGCNANRIFKGVLDNDFYNRYTEVKKEFNSFKLDIKSNTRNLEKIKYSMLEQALINKPDLFVLDYIQNIERKNETEYELMTRAGNELQDLAKKINTPILIISQVSNEHAKAQSSSVMSLKGSGGLAQVADNVLELKVENDDDEKSFRQASGAGLDIKATIKKSRNGYTGSFNLTFYGKTGEFVEKDLSNSQANF